MRILPLILLTISVPVAVFAQSVRSADDVLDALQLPRLLSILQTEALASGLALAESMAVDPQSRGSGWADTVSRINDPDLLGKRMREDFSGALPDGDIPALLEFWQSVEGQEIVSLELSAREALLDPDLEDAIMERFADVAEDGTLRSELLARFIDVNDLIESNVVGAMNANAAFLRGLRRGAPSRGFGPSNDSAILSEVWDQEAEIRLETVAWLYGFLSLAYQPMSDAELEAYIAFSDSAAGQAFNTALFVAFDRMFVSTSRETGLALARYLTSEDI